MNDRTKGLTALAIASVCVLATAKCSALDLVPENWTKADTARQIAYTAVLAIDAGQTADIKNHDDIAEQNPVAVAMIGENPTTGATAAYFVGAGIVHYAISASLKPKHRKVWQNVSLSFNSAIVANNFRIGLSWGF